MHGADLSFCLFDRNGDFQLRIGDTCAIRKLHILIGYRRPPEVPKDGVRRIVECLEDANTVHSVKTIGNRSLPQFPQEFLQRTLAVTRPPANVLVSQVLHLP